VQLQLAPLLPVLVLALNVLLLLGVLTKSPHWKWNKGRRKSYQARKMATKYFGKISFQI
jgi:hypothetical protein